MNRWTINSAEMVHLALTNPDYSQKELGKILDIKQNAVSTRLKRAYYDEISALLIRFENKIKEFVK